MIKVLLVGLTKPYISDYMDGWVEEVADSLGKAGLRNEVLVWTETLKPSMKCFDWDRRQYFAPCILSQLRDYFRELLSNYYVVGIGYIDAYDRGLNFVFGEADPSSRVASVFTLRLDPVFYGESRNYNLYYERAAKEIVHELGHLLGLGHCMNRECVMSFSNSVYDVDHKSRYYCSVCRDELSAIHSHS